MVRSQPEVTVSQIVEPLKKAVKTQKKLFGRFAVANQNFINLKKC